MEYLTGKVHNKRKAQEIIDRIGKDFPVIYVWRWSGDDRYAKIGITETIGKLPSRLIATYHPTDDPILIGFMECCDFSEAKHEEKYYLYTLKRTRPDREWVIIDEKFTRIIDEVFISDPPANCRRYLGHR